MESVKKVNRKGTIRKHTIYLPDIIVVKQPEKPNDGDNDLVSKANISQDNISEASESYSGSENEF